MVAEEVLERLPDDGAVLISGAPMTGKYDLLLDLIAETADYSVIVTTKYRGRQVITDLTEARNNGGLPVGVVDCVPVELPIEDGGSPPNGSRLRQVNGPGDLTSIGVQFTELSSAMADDFEARSVTVGLHSLAQLAMHSDVQSVYKFLQVVVGNVRSQGWLGLAVMDEVPGEELDLSALEHHFDGVVETALAGGVREFRLRGQRGATDWHAF